MTCFLRVASWNRLAKRAQLGQERLPGGVGLLTVRTRGEPPPAAADIKEFYREFGDKIHEKRLESPYPLRRAVHLDIYSSVLEHIRPGMTVLDAGCGEGALSILMARLGARVVGSDLSEPNLVEARRRALGAGIGEDLLRFEQGDAEALPFEDASFDLVVSNHVLEHLPDFDAGLAEVRRITRGRALIGLPTCLNPCAWVLLGGADYWRLSLRAPLSVAFGMARVVGAGVTGAEGVDEGYVSSNMPHIFRFPGRVRRRIEAGGFRVIEQRAQSLCIPFVPWTFTTPSRSKALSWAGIGTLFVLEKV